MSNNLEPTSKRDFTGVMTASTQFAADAHAQVKALPIARDHFGQEAGERLNRISSIAGISSNLRRDSGVTGEVVRAAREGADNAHRAGNILERVATAEAAPVTQGAKASTTRRPTPLRATQKGPGVS